MRNLLTTLCICLLASFAGAALAQTPDGQTPAVEDVCNAYSGGDYGLCNAYCEAMDCELANDGDEDTNPSASASACHRVGSKFTNRTGDPLPCETTDPVFCPCGVDEMGMTNPNWSDDVGISQAGISWHDLATGDFIPAKTTCTDDGDVTLTYNDPEAMILKIAGVRLGANGEECFAFPDLFGGTGTLPVTADEAASCRGILRQTAVDNGVTCTP